MRAATFGMAMGLSALLAACGPGAAPPAGPPGGMPLAEVAQRMLDMADLLG